MNSYDWQNRTDLAPYIEAPNRDWGFAQRTWLHAEYIFRSFWGSSPGPQTDPWEGRDDTKVVPQYRI